MVVIFVLLLLSNHKKLKDNAEKCVDGQVVPNYPVESYSLIIKIVNKPARPTTFVKRPNIMIGTIIIPVTIIKINHIRLLATIFDGLTECSAYVNPTIIPIKIIKPIIGIENNKFRKLLAIPQRSFNKTTIKIIAIDSTMYRYVLST
jgi:hypothetical protein